MSALFTQCFVMQNDQVLLQHRTRPPYAGMWNAPGGKMRLLETPHEACVREVREETGLTVRNPRLRAVVTVGSVSDDVEETVILFVFAADQFAGTLTPSIEGQLRWWPLSSVHHGPDIVYDLRHLLPYVTEDEPRPLFGKMIYEAGKLATCDFRIA